MTSKPVDEIFFYPFDESEALRGNNFLVSAIHLLKKQKRELQDENAQLKTRLAILERQNAAFLDLSADRLLQERG